MAHGFVRSVLKSTLFPFMVVFLAITAGASAKSAPVPRSYPLPPETYLFHVGSGGTLAYQVIEPNKGCAGFACRLYRNSHLGAEFTPIETFASVNAIFAGPQTVGVQSGTEGAVFVWAQKRGGDRFALYATSDAGATWHEVPDTEAADSCCPYRVVPNILSPERAYLLPVPPGEAAISLHHFRETRDGGKTWEERSLPGKIPAADGFFFDPGNSKKIWAWRGSKGGWTGVQYSKDGGVTWQSLQIPAENRIHGAILNPYTGEIIVTGRQVISRWCNGKGEDLREKCGLLPRTVFEAGPPLLDPAKKRVLVPVFWWEEAGGVKGKILAVCEGQVEKIADFATRAEPVYAWVGKEKLYLSGVGVGKNQSGELLIFSLPGAQPSIWRSFLPLAIGGLFLLLVLWGFKHRQRNRKNE